MKATLFVLIFFHLFSINLSGQIEMDSIELVKLYHATNGEEWINTWDLETPVYDWYGIEVSENRVTNITLGGNNLVGFIPDLNLDQLWGFSLQDNSLTDTIPNFSFFSNLNILSLQRNTLTGNLPDFTSLPLLMTLNCADNELEGAIPSFQNTENLSRLICNNNKLTGEIPEFAHLENFNLCNINNNQLSGGFPDLLPASLEVLNCTFNNLTGALPNLQQTPNIKVFNCGENQLSGEIPGYQNLQNLQSFRCENNNLEGEIPAFENLPSLSYYDCSGNNLSGGLPTFNGTPSLRLFSCAENQLTGTIPDYFYLLDLKQLYCYDNQLSGVIPDITGWLKLTSLLVQNNDLHGIIPPEKPDFFNQLKCSNNNISGCYPDYICDLWRFESENNSLLPWQGNHEPFCLGEPQIGAPCDDGRVETINDAITEECNCNDLILSSSTEQIENSISISPNPASDKLQLEGDLNDAFVVQISDINGRKVLQEINTKYIDISSLIPGIYFVTIILENGKIQTAQKVTLY